MRGVAFLATPHRGADLAALGDLLRIIVRPSKAVSAMIRNDPDLRELNEGYRDLARNISHLVLTESKPLYKPIEAFGFTLAQSKKIGVIVKEDDADPGLETTPIQIAADHVEIAKPPGRDSDVYVFVRQFIRSIVSKQAPETAQSPVEPLPPPLATAPKNPQALAVWHRRLETLLVSEAKTTNALALIEIQNGIEEAKAKIRELGGET